MWSRSWPVYRCGTCMLFLLGVDMTEFSTIFGYDWKNTCWFDPTNLWLLTIKLYISYMDDDVNGNMYIYIFLWLVVHFPWFLPISQWISILLRSLSSLPFSHCIAIFWVEILYPSKRTKRAFVKYKWRFSKLESPSHTVTTKSSIVGYCCTMLYLYPMKYSNYKLLYVLLCIIPPLHPNENRWFDLARKSCLTISHQKYPH